MTSPRRLDSEAVSALSESSSQVHELMLRHRDEVAGLRTRIKEQAAEHEDVVKRLRTEQEKQHDQHREQLREMNAQHQKKTLQLQTALDEAVLVRTYLYIYIYILLCFFRFINFFCALSICINNHVLLFSRLVIVLRKSLLLQRAAASQSKTQQTKATRG